MGTESQHRTTRFSSVPKDRPGHEREARRLAALDSYRILDTAPESAFDDLVRIAAQVCNVPMALISLVDGKRQWAKAALGLDASETWRSVAFCAHAIRQHDIFLVEDASQDERFSTNPLVTGDLNLRFYAGAPLITADGHTLGTLCVLDEHPHTLTKAQRLALQALARQVMTQLDLRKAQRAAEESASQFHLYTQTLPNHAWSATPEGLIDWSNDRLHQYAGLKPGDAGGQGWMHLIHADDREVAVGRWSAALSSGQIYESELRIRRADGEYRWHLARALPIRSPEGNIVRWIGTNTDIHERKLNETRTVLERDRIWTLSQELMLVCDLSGVISEVNPSATRILGYRSEEMIGHRVAEFIHPDDVPSMANELQKLSQGMAITHENRYRAKDGSFRLLGWTAVPELGRVHAIARDITEERATSEDREHIWNSTNDLMATLGKDGYLKAVNPAWKRLLGYSAEELLSRPLIQHIIPEDRPKLEKVLSRLAEGEEVVNLEDHLLHKDGTQSLMAWSAEPVGDLYYIVGRNVTEQRATEDALRQSLKMEAVGQLTGGIAHDFNNLLQGITGSLDLIKRRTAQGRYTDVERYVTGAMASASRASALTHRLLAFSRRQPLSPKPLELNPLITSMEELLRRTLGENIRLELVVAGGTWLTKCDRNQLENAVLNLAINARDAMPDGGTLTIETANVHLDRAHASKSLDIEPGQYVCISVTDTGTGMSADTIAKAFEPFFTTKPLGRGTGLGLSMIYGFAKQSGGYAKIYSELGRGTTFKLYMPRFRGEAEMKEALPTLGSEHTSRRNETVLVVEDEIVVRELIVEILEELGYHPIEAEDGPSGLKVLESDQPIDLIITDIGLPGLNGRQIVEAGRIKRPDLKVLFMTGYAENAVIASGFLESGMSMITKPFAMEQLATRIREMLAGAQ